MADPGLLPEVAWLMLHLTVIPDVESTGFKSMVGLASQDDPRLIRLADEANIEVGALAGGMASGRASVAFCFTLPDGRVVVAETSLALFLLAADALRARYGEQR